jgi:cell division protein FtsB
MAQRKRDNWLAHALQRTGWQPQRQVVALATLGFVLALILGGLYLSQVVSEATTNRRLDTLLDERDDLERENEQLRSEIARLKSVPALIVRAEARGFTLAQPGQIEYLVVEGYAPIQADTVAPIDEEDDTDDDIYDETFADWLGAQWRSLTNGVQSIFGG